MTVQDLRDVLREHGDGPAPANPTRPDQVRARIRRMRRRRRAVMVAGAGAAVTTVAALGFAFLPGTAAAPRPADDTAVVPTSADAPELPESFTSADGAEYRRLDLVSLARTGPRKATVTIPVTGRPLDVAVTCAGSTRAASPKISIGRRPVTAGVFCRPGRQLVALPVPAGGAKEATVTFDTTTHGTACTREKPGGPCRPVKEERGDWSLAVYEWTPPAQPVEPEAPRPLPRRAGAFELAESRSGTWPRESSVTFRVRGDGRPIGVDQICTGDLADRLEFRYELNGRDTGASSSCGVWKRGAFPSAIKEFAVPKGRSATITVKASMRAEAPDRLVRWSVGLFRE
ncbi:hypothetical protein FHU36_008759 [Nonomuraea muscovyensis]|uniref:Uncharacterized protein n=1 Tax=Nonomuraea muscovyensis TaxID=1124761 RepID=A0A7X0CCH6_9ACTN|nr:hypothetical protein [Nonomuraea muscovyensis]MBB6352163.1 hypothetical protein [Nonomuraea muscovyensis]